MVFSILILYWGGDNNYDCIYPKFENSELYAFGVIDTPEQFYEKFGKILEDDKRPLVVSFTHVAKNPENAGYGGGWRWRKWGQYYGEGEPTTEYLNDEDGFADGVYCFHIYVANNLISS